MSNVARPSRLRRLLRIGRETGGVGAVEFAMIAPFLVALYVGASELTLGITADRKVSNAAATIGDLVAQESSVTRAQLGGIQTLARTLVAPLEPARMSTIVTSVRIDDTRRATVDWSTDPGRYTQGTDFRGLPSGVAKQAGRFLIVTESRYEYKPTVSVGTLGTFTMTRRSYNQPRLSASVVCTDCT